MPKQKLFDDDSEEEVTLKTENDYAKKYDAWREKEEIHKLEQKYGPKALDPDATLSSDSEDESDESPEVSEEVEEQFLKTLALLKTKDPRIYDPSYKFFEEKKNEEVMETKKKTLTFADSDDDDDDGNIFSIEKKADIVNDDAPSSKEKSEAGKDAKLKDFLTGKVEHIDDPVEQDLAPLKALWSDPKLNEGEAFLRDYILNKKYLEEGEVDGSKLRDDEALEEDEQTVEDQGRFERAYNFRFEEPDQEYLKRFPRTMNYIRPKDDRRSRKRAEVRDRKEEQKRQKMEEIGRLKALKLKEIQEKIAKIKEVTGNDELAFKEDDIEGDFDPMEHDRRMRAIFDEHYYGTADDEKPVFPDLDEELEIENWENCEGDQYREGNSHHDEGPHCEDDDFNMDADYNPKHAREKLLQEIQTTLGKKRRNRKKKSKLAKLLATEKPKFIPETDKTYDEYMEEYYKMDCEDVIGDLPTRFKYREVVPNDYGLTVEEILLADDKELTQWVPLKKLVRHKPDSVQKSEVNTYKQKAADLALKKKILPSLFKDIPEEPELVVPKETQKKKKKTKNKNKEIEDTEDKESNDVSSDHNGEVKPEKRPASDEINNDSDENKQANDPNNAENGDAVTNTKRKKKKQKRKEAEVCETTENYSDITEQKKKNVDVAQRISTSIISNDVEDDLGNQKTDEYDEKLNENGKKKRKKKNKGFEIEDVKNATPSQESTINENKSFNLKRKADNQPQDSEIPGKKKKKGNAKQSNHLQRRNNKDFKSKFNMKVKNKNKDNSSDDPLSKLSDERLKAYGLNPKKYRSFLKYKKF